MLSHPAQAHPASAEQGSLRFGARGGSPASLGKGWATWGLSGFCLSYSNLTLISFLYLDIFSVFFFSFSFF